MLLIIRGLPGAGKSTLARALCSAVPGAKRFEADDFFYKEGEYHYDSAYIKQAHKTCLYNVRYSLENRAPLVIVSNTFREAWEMRPYAALARELEVDLQLVEVQGNWPSIHAPDEVRQRMAATWQRVTLTADKHIQPRK